MIPLFYDNGSSGHHPGYVAGIVEAAQGAGMSFLVASVSCPSPLPEDALWIPVSDHPLRSVVANRREIAKATATASERGADVLIDLYLDQQIWAADAARALRRRVHVLHHSEQYLVDVRRGFARMRTHYLRRHLRRLSRRGAMVVVHSQRTADVLEGVVPEARLAIAGYPVRPLAVEKRVAAAERPTLLFVGAGRHEKGLDVLLTALTLRPDLGKLRVVGRQPNGLREQVNSAYPEVDIEWNDGYVEDAELHDAYATSHLAVLPYRPIFGLHGGPSSVLLETMSAGIPIVTTTALTEQLPPGYAGARIVTADSAEALAEGLVQATATMDSMAAAAAEDGRRFVARNHSYESYVRTLVEAAKMATE